MSTDTATAGTLDAASNDDYHNAERFAAYVSHSGLDLFRKDPAEFKGRYVTRDIPPNPPTADQQFGSAFHCAVLEPEQFERRYIVAPNRAPDGSAWNFRTKEHKAARADWMIEVAEADESHRLLVAAMKVDEWPAWLALNCKAVILELEERETIMRMVEAVYAHKEAAEMLKTSLHREHAIWWRDEETGILCKSMRDLVGPPIEFSHGRFDEIGDFKTCLDNSPEAFNRAVYRYGYHRQAPFYCNGHEAFADWRAIMRYVAVRKTPPWESAVAIYDLPEEAIELGREQNARALKQLARRRERQDWQPDWAKGVTTLPFPGWAKNEQYELDLED